MIFNMLCLSGFKFGMACFELVDAFSTSIGHLLFRPYAWPWLQESIEGGEGHRTLELNQ